MPHPFPRQLEERIAAGSLTITEVVLITPPYGALVALTRFPLDLTIGTLTYKAAPGMSLSKTQSTIELSIDNAECATIWEDGEPPAVNIGVGDLLGGRFEKAKWQRGVVDYEDLAAGVGVTGRGRVGAVKLTDHRVSFELLALSQLVQLPVGEVLSPSCRIVKLGDSWCQANLDGIGPKGQPFRVNGVTVGTVSGEMTFTFSGAAAVVDSGWFRAGQAYFTGGPNAGQDIEIAIHEVLGAGSHLIQLLYPPGWGLAASRDTLNLEAGCDRTMDACDGKFSNKYHFRGEPFTVGDTDLAQGAEGKSGA